MPISTVEGDQENKAWQSGQNKLNFLTPSLAIALILTL